jgi:tRNA pseudouridine55 synthase
MATRATDGILLVDKPAGLSSHDVVAIVRRARGGARAGHTGTLDPFATGLLLVALGRATRLIRFLPSEPKVYRATIAFGIATDTDDSTGNVVAQGDVPDERVARGAIAQLTGTFEQVPPDFSARHVEGRRAYAIARAGGTPDLSATTVMVHDWAVGSFAAGSLAVDITCSSGTYIRALARDLGRLCGTVAHLATLRRLRIGPFDVRDATTPDAAPAADLLAPARALLGMPRQVLDGAEVDHVQHGRAVAAREPGDTVSLVDDAGELVAVAEREGEWWQPRVVMVSG